MKRLTLSTTLFALTLSSAAFANGAQEQAPASVATPTAAISVFTVVPAPTTVSVTRAVLAQVERDVREQVLNSLRARSPVAIEAVQAAAPAAETAKMLDLSAR